MKCKEIIAKIEQNSENSAILDLLKELEEIY